MRLEEPRPCTGTVGILPLQPEQGRAHTVPICLLYTGLMPLQNPPVQLQAQRSVVEDRRFRNFDRLGGAGVLNNSVRRLKKEELLLGTEQLQAQGWESRGISK